MRRVDFGLEEAVVEAVYERLADEARERFNDINPLLWLRLEEEGFLSDHAVILGAWNNVPGRTHAEVLALIDSAIARQRARIPAG